MPSSGRAAIAAALKSRPIHVAWGAGLSAWDALAAGDLAATESPAATTLVAELGRRPADEVTFVLPSPTGELEINGVGKFTRTATPTNQLIVLVAFAFADAPTATVREIAVFCNTVVAPSVPLGQLYVTPAELTSPGIMLSLEHRPAISRSPATREGYNLLLTF